MKWLNNDIHICLYRIAECAVCVIDKKAHPTIYTQLVTVYFIIIVTVGESSCSDVVVLA